MNDNLEDKFPLLKRKAPQYPVEAYRFVALTVSHAANSSAKHLKAAELIKAAGELAENNFGKLAGQVLCHWNIDTSEKFGEVVYLLISVKFLSQSPGDQRSDFDLKRKIIQHLAPEKNILLPTMPKVLS